MDNINNVNPAPQMNGANGAKRAETKQQAAPEMKKDGKKKIALGMAAAAAAAAVGIAIAAKTGKADKAAETLRNLSKKEVDLTKGGVIKDVKPEATMELNEFVKTAKGKTEGIIPKAAEAVQEKAGKEVPKAAEAAAKEVKPIKFKAAERLVSDKEDKVARLINNYTSNYLHQKVSQLEKKQESAYYKVLNKYHNEKLKVTNNARGVLARTNKAREVAELSDKSLESSMRVFGEYQKLIDNLYNEIHNLPKTPQETLSSKLSKLKTHIADINDSTAPEKVQGLLRQAEAATGKPCTSASQALINLEAIM